MNQTTIERPRGIPAELEEIELPQFGRASLNHLTQEGGIGYQDTTGVHIYCELRLVEELRAAATDDKALKCLQTINDYAHYGMLAAQPFGVTLLELQGPVLHFYREGLPDVGTIRNAIQFAHIFTSTLYEVLKDDLGNDWHGFATCMDDGRSVIVRHGSFSSSSAVSLGPVANRPAKQLLYGKTAAGAVDVPARWANLLGLESPSREWLTLALKDREWIPFTTALENRQLREQFDHLVRSYRNLPGRTIFSRLAMADSARIHNAEGFTVDAPLRVEAFANRADLDGFSQKVEQAFKAGDDAIDRLARDFGRILEFGEHMETTTPGSIRLPFAGDCGTLLVPAGVDGDLTHLRSSGWLHAAIRWKDFGQDSSEGRRMGWSQVFQSVGWAIGSACGEATSCVVAPIEADHRRFLVAVGWPLDRSQEAQNLGRGGEIIVHAEDFAFLPKSVQALFCKVAALDYWKGSDLTLEKIRQAQIKGAESRHPRTSTYITQVSGIQIPRSRPYGR